MSQPAETVRSVRWVRVQVVIGSAGHLRILRVSDDSAGDVGEVGERESKDRPGPKHSSALGEESLGLTKVEVLEQVRRVDGVDRRVVERQGASKIAGPNRRRPHGKLRRIDGPGPRGQPPQDRLT